MIPMPAPSFTTLEIIMKNNEKTSSTRLDSILSILVLAVAFSAVGYGAFAAYVSPLVA